MKKVIKIVDEKKGVVQCTFADERFYAKPSTNDVTGLPEYKFVPSVTFITGSYPKGISFYKWLAERSWDESEAIKQAAGNKGSKVHLAIADVLQGKEVRIDSKYPNRDGIEEELTLEECDCIISFANWFKEENPKVLAWETTVFSDQNNYAGTIDFICEIEGQTWIIDFKTSPYIWPEYELQLAAYKRTVENGENVFHGVDVTNIKTAILQVGYKRNKAGFKFTEIEDKFNLFLAAQTIWKNEHGGESVSKKDYPIVLSPALSAQDVLKEESNDKQRKVDEAGGGSAKTKVRRA